ncbi:hypothetical protein CVT26_006437 [Gymnopilus dilepis]|uniref:N-acetyltransferase domain-containing protein n=1 Tax=Gymnopilus dilepis TaxID=231916 RepID=A0A409Y1X0_9AGAR|nr:hypothetical protein CVT26_006437 [Gymnopilus dilepis]
MPSKTAHTIRPATPADLPQIIAIMNHYIAHTVISLRMDALTLTDYEGIFSSVRAQGLPFFVTETPSRGHEAQVTGEEGEGEEGETGKKVTGFAYAHGFRPTYTGYRHTAEITIYVHPSYHSQGVGTLLMDTLMGALRATNSSSSSSPPSPSTNSSTSPSPNPSPDSSTSPIDANEHTPPIKQVLSLMSLNEDGPNGGWGLRDWYARWGFEQIGHMKRVGYKFGRWVDVVMMQVSLE